jgi:shikimate kinase
MNIILIGMPGAGKSTLGVLLAKALGKDFVDTDIFIQQKEGLKLYEIINNVGIGEFLALEESSILDLEVVNSVVATGGSVIYGSKAMEYLKKNGIVVYLKLGYEDISRRLQDITTRGIAFNKKTSLNELYNERAPLYEKYADLIIDCTNRGIEETIDHLIKMLTIKKNAHLDNEI